MSFPALPTALAWLAPLFGIAALGLFAAVALLRDVLRLERLVVTLQGEVARLRSDASQSAPPPKISSHPQSEGAAALAAEPNQQAMPHTYPQHVLLAEDNETNALLVLSALEHTGATVDWARDGDEAVSLVEQSFANRRPPYDVVLMDLRMPKLDGMEATRQIRALEERFCRKEAVRIVAVTANAMKRDRTAAEIAGIDAFLPKPYPARALLDLLGPHRPAIAKVT